MGKYDGTIYNEAMRVFDIRGAYECARGYLRYEVMRTMTTRSFKELVDRNFNGEDWDDMIDELIAKRLK